MTETTGYQPPYAAHLEPGSPDHYLGLGHRHHGIPALDWQQANQAGRWALVEGVVPGVSELTSDAGRAAVVRHLATVHAKHERVGLEAAVTESATAERGILPWDDLLAMGWSADGEQQHKAASNLNQMTSEERGVFGRWMVTTDKLFQEQAEQLHEGWALPWHNQWQGKQQNVQHWAAYRDLTAVEQAHYKRWLTAQLLHQTQAQRVQGGRPVPVADAVPVDRLYDIWRNTGRDESMVWRQYATLLKLSARDRSDIQAEFKNLDVLYLIEPDQDHWGHEYSRAIDKMQWNNRDKTEFADYTEWESGFMARRNAYPTFRATPEWTKVPKAARARKDE